jgi:preprotein translocase subunit SecD
VKKGGLVAVLVVFVVAVGAIWGVILVNGWGPALGLDLRGGVSIIKQPAPGQVVDEEILDQTVEIIRQRIDALGVAEPDIARQGDNILVQLPGVADQEQAEDIIGRTALLQFRRVLEIVPPGSPDYDEVSPPCDEIERRVLEEGPPPAEEEVVLCETATGAEATELDPDLALAPGERLKYRLGPVALDGGGVTDARAVVDPVAGIQWQTNLDLDRQGARDFAAITGELACEPLGVDTRRMAIVLDGIVESAPTMSDQVLCNQGITGGNAVITVGGGREAAEELALVLRTGALPILLETATSQSVSPTLGRASLNAGLLAGLIGLILVAVYMIALYRGIGVAAIVELGMFGLLVIGMIVVLGNTVGFTLTLAGVAGIIVSIGIAADSSIIYRERYRDEIRSGRTVRTAADHAWRKAWRTNLTGNTVAFIAAVVLYFLAVGPVRGFAFTLGLSTLIDTILFGTFTRSLFGLIAQNPKLAKAPWVGLRAQEVAPDIVEGGAA